VSRDVAAIHLFKVKNANINENIGLMSHVATLEKIERRI
jgi:hypothetical protein